MFFHKLTCVLISLAVVNVASECTWIDRNPVQLRDCPNENDLPYEAECTSVINYGGSINCEKDGIWTPSSNGLIINLYNSDSRPFNEIVTTIVKLRMIGGVFVEIPSEIFQMTNLIELKISSNPLRSVNFNEFLPLSKLKKINLSNNNISVIETVAVSRTTYSNVVDIDVSNGAIESIPNNFLGQFRNLEYLNLSHNIISSIDLHTFEGAVQLKTLDLSFNKLHEIGKVFASIPKRHDPNYGPWINLGKLSRLVLDNNLLRFINFADFIDTEISELSIGGNQIPCDILTDAKNSNYSETFDRITTAITLNCRSKNVNGIPCQNLSNNTSNKILDPSNLNANPIVILLKNAIENNTKTVNNLIEIAHKNERAIENIEHIIEPDNGRLNSTDSKLSHIIDVLDVMKKHFVAIEVEEIGETASEIAQSTQLNNKVYTK